jgi:hypothetical protein
MAVTTVEQENKRPLEGLKAVAEIESLNREMLAGNASDLGAQETQMGISLDRGKFYADLARDGEAEASFASALAIAERLAKQYPTDLYFLRDLAEVHEAIARFHLSRDRKPQAEQSARKAAELWERWPNLAVSSKYDQTHRARLASLLKEIQGTNAGMARALTRVNPE